MCFRRLSLSGAFDRTVSPQKGQGCGISEGHVERQGKRRSKYKNKLTVHGSQYDNDGSLRTFIPVFSNRQPWQGRKKSSRDFLLLGKRKAWFSLSLQINDFQCQSLIWAPRAGRVDDFLRVHQILLSYSRFWLQGRVVGLSHDDLTSRKF